MKPLRPNYKHIRGPWYVVRTQAGFRRAVNHFCDGDWDRVDGYPRKYPALVCLSMGYDGSVFPRADCLHLEEVKYALEGE